MIRLLALLMALSAPAAAQHMGPCSNGMLWWAIPGVAGFGPCERPETGFFLLSCRDDAPILEIESPYAIDEGADGQATLTIDGAAFDLTGTGTAYPRTGVIGLGAIAVPPPALLALAQGSRASFTLPSETRDIHLTGSADAVAILLQGCGGA